MHKITSFFLSSIAIQCLTASTTEGEGIEKGRQEKGAELFRPVADKRTGSMGKSMGASMCPLLPTLQAVELTRLFPRQQELLLTACFNRA